MRRIVGDPWFYPVLFVAGGLTFMIAGARLQQVGMIVAGLVLAGCAVTYRCAVRVRSRPFAGAQAHVEGGGVVATDATRARLKDTLRQHAGGDA